MDVREIDYVMATAKYQNITKAHIGQPGLSKILASLEEELGLELFSRADKKYILTYDGERYIAYALSILDTKDEQHIELAALNNNRLILLSPE